MRLHLAAGLLAIVAAGGCYATTDVGYGYSAGYVAPAPVYATTTTATVSVDTYQPDLVDVGGGVQVIADYDEPVFYTDNYYWRFYGGSWYRSNVYNGGWTVYSDVPYSVRRIDRPHAYVRYRPSGYVPRTRDHRNYNRGYQQPAVRDHRNYDRGYRQPAPAVRDHRTYDRGYQQPAVRDHRNYDRPAPQPAVRDHRSYDRPAPQAQPARDHRQAPATRDHRDDRRDDSRDNRSRSRR